jgi:hypothetical protein
VQGLFEASPELVIAQHQQVAVLQEVSPVSGPETIDAAPDPRRAGERVEIAPTLSVFRDFEGSESLGFRHKDDVDIAIVCAEVCLPLDCAA